jgi:murein L,D-transpeptidase YafK
MAPGNGGFFYATWPKLISMHFVQWEMKRYLILFAIIPVALVSIIFNFAKIQHIVNPEQPVTSTIDRLVVLKSERKLLAYSNGRLIKTYCIALGKNPLGHKEFEGDMKTPEGIYTISGRNPNSDYYKNLGISYPNKNDCAHAEKLGKSPGGLIKIHGLPNRFPDLGSLHYLTDWTHGCIAVTNEEIDELYNRVPDGTTIEIRP